MVWVYVVVLKLIMEILIKFFENKILGVRGATSRGNNKQKVEDFG